MSEQIERWACVRETDKTYLFAIKQPVPTHRQEYENLQRQADDEWLLMEGSQLFVFNKTSWDQQKFARMVIRQVANMEANGLGPLAYDPHISHVSERRIPDPKPLDQL